MLRIAQSDITRFARSYIAPDGRSDIIFALKFNARSAYHITHLCISLAEGEYNRRTCSTAGTPRSAFFLRVNNWNNEFL